MASLVQPRDPLVQPLYLGPGEACLLGDLLHLIRVEGEGGPGVAHLHCVLVLTVKVTAVLQAGQFVL